MSFFDIQNIAVKIWDYPISFVELIGTLFGLISVYLASKANIFTWPTGIVNEFFLFLLFFQVQLYADMFLQVYFFITTLYGWYNWKKNIVEKKVSTLDFKSQFLWLAAIGVFSLIAGFLFTNIHLYLPMWFKVPAAWPFVDSFILVASMAATVLLARKKIETWYLWIAIDVVCTGLYLKKEVYFLAFEYFIFLGLASYGLYNWKKLLKHG